MKDLLDECLYALNMLPNKRYVYEEQKTTTYKLAKRLGEMLNAGGAEKRPPKPFQRCYSCKYLTKFQDDTLRCCRHSPVEHNIIMPNGTSQVVTSYPITYRGNHCGEFHYNPKWKETDDNY